MILVGPPKIINRYSPSLSLSFFLSIHISMRVYISIDKCIYIYLYIYMCIHMVPYIHVVCLGPVTLLDFRKTKLLAVDGPRTRTSPGPKGVIRLYDQVSGLQTLNLDSRVLGPCRPHYRGTWMFRVVQADAEDFQ